MSNTVNFGGFQVDLSQINFNDHSSRVDNIKATNIALIVLSVFVVVLRLLARVITVRKLFVDDILIVLATAFTVGLAATSIAGTSHGLGTHIWLIPVTSIIPEIKSVVLHLFICQVLYACAIALTKIAIIASYLRFISNRNFRMSMYVVGVISIGLWVTGVCVTLFQCNPVNAAWDFTLRSKKCINYVAYLYASSAINILTDVLICVLPWPHLWKLNMPVRQRIILCVLIAGGIGACIVCAIRMAFLQNLYKMDTTYESVPALNLSVLECSLGIVCISIPALRPLGQRLFPNGLRSNSASKRRSHTLPLSNMTPQPGRSTIEEELKGDDIIISQESLSDRTLPHEQV